MVVKAIARVPPGASAGPNHELLAARRLSRTGSIRPLASAALSSSAHVPDGGGATWRADFPWAGLPHQGSVAQPGGNRHANHRRADPPVEQGHRRTATPHETLLAGR